MIFPDGTGERRAGGRVTLSEESPGGIRGWISLSVVEVPVCVLPASALLCALGCGNLFRSGISCCFSKWLYSVWESCFCAICFSAGWILVRIETEAIHPVKAADADLLATDSRDDAAGKVVGVCIGSAVFRG